jgi:hypothetical protein
VRGTLYEDVHTSWGGGDWTGNHLGIPARGIPRGESPDGNSPPIQKGQKSNSGKRGSIVTACAHFLTCQLSIKIAGGQLG